MPRMQTIREDPGLGKQRVLLSYVITRADSMRMCLPFWLFQTIANFRIQWVYQWCAWLFAELPNLTPSSKGKYFHTLDRVLIINYDTFVDAIARENN